MPDSRSGAAKKLPCRGKRISPRWLFGSVEHFLQSTTYSKIESPTPDDAVIADLRSHLISGRLVAYGRATRYATDLTPIPSAAWVQLVFRDCRRSIVAEGGSRSPIITDVRIFPVLYVDDIADRLHGMTLVQAFRDYVFGDFQLACLQKKPVGYGGEHRQLSRRPALYSSYWDVRHGEVPKRATLGYYMDGRDGPAAHHANEVLRLRFGRLVSLLAEEKLIAEGVSRSDGSRVSISLCHVAPLGGPSRSNERRLFRSLP